MEEIKDLLKEARDLLILCSLLDESGHCSKLVEKIDNTITWQ